MSNRKTKKEKLRTQKRIKEGQELSHKVEETLGHPIIGVKWLDNGGVTITITPDMIRKAFHALKENQGGVKAHLSDLINEETFLDTLPSHLRNTFPDDWDETEATALFENHISNYNYYRAIIIEKIVNTFIQYRPELIDILIAGMFFQFENFALANFNKELQEDFSVEKLVSLYNWPLEMAENIHKMNMKRSREDWAQECIDNYSDKTKHLFGLVEIEEQTESNKVGAGGAHNVRSDLKQNKQKFLELYNEATVWDEFQKFYSNYHKKLNYEKTVQIKFPKLRKEHPDLIVELTKVEEGQTIKEKLHLVKLEYAARMYGCRAGLYKRKTLNEYYRQACSAIKLPEFEKPI